MSLTRHNGGWVIAFTFIAALALTMLPLPDWAEGFRPEWVAMVLVYWCLALPDRVGVGIGWSMGLLLDVVRGALLGQNALALAFIAYVVVNLYQRLRIFPLWQQALFVLVLIALDQLLVLWVKGVIGQPPQSWLYWLPSVTSMLLWPWVFLILRDLRRQFQVR